METIEPSPRLSRLGEKLQKLHPVGWLGKLLRWSETKAEDKQGGDGMSNGHGDGDSASKNRAPDSFQIPTPTIIFGSSPAGPFEPFRSNQPPAGPSQAELENRPLIYEAMAIDDPWADKEPPPLYSRRPTRK